MFPHVISYNNVYIIRRWNFGWQYWSVNTDYWWCDLNKYVSRFDNVADLKKAWAARKHKFEGWL